MKKLLLLFVLPIFINAQSLSYDAWEKVETVDDFGDKTGEYVLRTFSNGSFSNSATVGSKLLVKYSDYGGSSILTLFEYERTPAKIGTGSAFGSIKIKLTSGDVVSVDAFAPKSGGLFFSKESYIEISKYMRNGKGDVLRFVIKESDFSKYGNAKYSFSLTTITEAEINKFEL